MPITGQMAGIAIDARIAPNAPAVKREAEEDWRK
jgi:hypothetical protein